MLTFAAPMPPPGPPMPSGRSARRPRRRRRWRGLAVPVVVIVVAGAGVAFWWSRDDEAIEWDARLVEAVEAAESLRELEFLESVPVEFLDDDAFRAELAAEGADLTHEDREELERVAALLRAFGLLDGDLDLEASRDQLLGEAVLAYYSWEDARIVVRGTELDVPTRATLVHELVHALQDQHFGLGELLDDPGDADASALLGLVEGDAVDVERRYVASLTSGEQDEYFAAQDGDLDALELDGVPDVLVAALGLPYALGPELVRLLRLEGGMAQVDAAFASPPTSTFHLLDPRRYLAGEEPVPVAAPELPAEANPVDDEPAELGPVLWYLALAERLDPVRALESVDGWRGDRAVTFERDGRVCARVTVATADAAARDALGSALDDWIAAAPVDHAARTGAGEEIDVTTCDPGPTADGPGGRAVETLLVPATRVGVFGELVGEGFDEPVAWCVGDEVVRRFSATELADEELLTSPGAVAELQQMLLACL